jgi:hypothetical protein
VVRDRATLTVILRALLAELLRALALDSEIGLSLLDIPA